MKKILTGISVISITLFAFTSSLKEYNKVKEMGKVNKSYIAVTAKTHAKYHGGKDASGHIVYQYIDKIDAKVNNQKIKVGTLKLKGKKGKIFSKKIESVLVVNKVQIKGNHHKSTLDLLKKKKRAEVGTYTLDTKKDHKIRKVVRYIKEINVNQK
jgi:hypothetical protein